MSDPERQTDIPRKAEPMTNHSQLLPLDGIIMPLEKDCEAQFTLRVSDDDLVYNQIETPQLPNPYGTGALLRGHLGDERIFVYFPPSFDHDTPDADKDSIGHAILTILLCCSGETFSPPEDQSVFSLTGRGDWMRLIVAGEDRKMFVLKQVEITEHSSPSGNHTFS